MKFNELSILTQLKIASELTGQNPNAVLNSHNRYALSRPDETVSNIFKEHGITYNRTLSDDALNCNIYIPANEGDTKNMSMNYPPLFNHRKNITFRRNTLDTVAMDFHSDTTDNTIAGVELDRFSIGGNIVIKGDVYQSLTDIIKMLKSFNVLWDNSSVIVKHLENLLPGFEKAATLPEELWDYLGDSKSLMLVFSTIRKVCQYSNYEYDEDSGNRVNLPPIIVDHSGMNGMEVVYTYMSDNPARAGHGLNLTYEEILGIGKGTIKLSNKSASGTTIELLSKEIDTDIDANEFIDILIESVIEVKDGAEPDALVIPLGENLIETLKLNRPYILQDIKDGSTMSRVLHPFG